MLKDNKNQNKNHYRCPKCFFFPYIQIIDKNKVNYICKCTDRKGKQIKIKDLINEIKDYEKNNKNINERNELRCSQHKHKFR